MQKHNSLIKLLCKNTSGSALVMTVVFCSVFLIIGTGTIKLISRGNQLHTREVHVVRSYWANEGALKIALRYLTREYPHPATIDDFNSGFIIINGYTPTVSINLNPTIPGQLEYDIVVNSKVDKMNNTTTVGNINYNSLARYTFFQQRFEDGVFWHGFCVDGNFHSNEILTIGKDMINEVHVTGEATCGSKYNGSYYYPDEYGTGIQVINPSTWEKVKKDLSWFKNRLPNYHASDVISTDPLAPESGAFDKGWVIEDHISGYNEYFVELIKDGNVKFYGLDGNDWEHEKTMLVSTFEAYNEGIIKSGKTIHIAGTLNGQLTVVTSDSMVIAGHILYHDVTKGQIPTYGTNDMLGLVSEGMIGIPDKFNLYNDDVFEDTNEDWEFDWKYENNLHIYGSTVARNGDIVPARDPYYYWKNYYRKNYIHIYGSHLCYESEGTSIAGYENYGFWGKYHGDPRYMDNLAAPPGLRDVRAKDEEVTTHTFDVEHKDGITMCFPINVPPSWENYIKK